MNIRNKPRTDARAQEKGGEWSSSSAVCFMFFYIKGSGFLKRSELKKKQYSL